MKTILILISLCLASTAFADGRTCGLHAHKKSDCDVVRVLTRCDVEKYRLHKRIAELEAEVKELKGRRLAPVVYRQVVVKEVEKKVIKHNILSLYMARDIANTNTTATSATVQTAYEPGLKYQYQFKFGFVPEVGVDVKGGFLMGLGYEF